MQYIFKFIQSFMQLDILSTYSVCLCARDIAKSLRDDLLEGRIK